MCEIVNNLRKLQSNSHSGSILANSADATGSSDVSAMAFRPDRWLLVGCVLVIALLGALDWWLYRATGFFELGIGILIGLVAAAALLLLVRRSSMAQIAEIADRVPCVVHEIRRRPNGEMRFTFVSGGLQQLLGISARQAIRDIDSVFAQVHEDDLPGLYEAIDRSARDLTPFDHEFRTRNTEGNIGWTHARSLPRRKRNGTVVWTGYWSDITDTVAARHELEASEYRREMAVDVSQLGTWTLNLDTGEVSWSERCAEIFGLSPDQVTSYEAFIERVHAEDQPHVNQAVQEALDLNSEFRTNYRIVLPDGKMRWVTAAGRIYRDRSGTQYLEGIVLDVSEYKAVEKKLAASLAQLTTQQEMSPDAIMATDPEFRVISYNRNFTRMWQIEPELLDAGDGQVVLDHMRSRLSDPRTFPERVTDIDKGLPRKHPLELKLTDGRIVEEHSAPMGNADGTDMGRVWYYRDVTRRKRDERALNEAKEAAEAANRAKSSFLATMSHEIRTPMNGVLGMLELLGLTDLDSEQRTTVQVIQQSTKSLQRLIDDILDLSKIEADKLEIHPEVASIKTLIEDIRAMFSGAAMSRGLAFSCEVDSAIHDAVEADGLRLKQILNNLISNALKFTEEGEIRVRAELAGQEDGRQWIRFSVTDSGIGIDPEQQSRLFRPFTQADNTITRRFGGTGLGLTICKRLTELMGGAINMESSPGDGTTMIVTVPLEKIDPSRLPEQPESDWGNLPRTAIADRRTTPSAEEAAQEGTLILVADDHPTNRLVIVRQLNALGYAAETAEDGEQALILWESGRYGLLLLDVNMPKVDGFEVARSIRDGEKAGNHKQTPLIAWTANALRGDAEACFLAGMDDYLAKPADLAELKEKLDYWLPISRSGENGIDRPDTKRSDAETPIDRSVLAVIAGDDEATIRDIFREFRHANDTDTTDLEQAIDRDNVEGVRRSAHRIKGASRMIGATRLSSAAEQIEQAAAAEDWEAIRIGRSALDKEREQLNDYVEQF